MKKLNGIIFSIVLAVSLQSFSQVGINPIGDQPADKADCISQSDIRDIASHFSQFSNLVGKEVCNDNSQTWHLLSSMMFMKRTAFDSNMPVSQDELFTGKFAKDWYQYFIGRINDIDVVDSCPKGVVAYVMAFGGKTMYVCPLALNDSFSSLDRASVFMHEARHIDGYPHVTCSKGPRAGIQGACDTKISGGGSYAVTVETYAQLAKYAKDLHPALKAYSKSSAIVYADEAFETPVKINRTDKLLVLTENLDFNLFDLSTMKSEKLGAAPVMGKIFKRGQHMVLIPLDKTEKARYVFARNEGELSQSPGDMITEYNSQTPQQKADLADIHNGAQFTARLYKSFARITCDPKSPATQDMKLPAGQVAASLLYPNGYDRAAKSVQLVTESGDVFDLGCQGTKGFLNASAMKFDQKFNRVYKIGSQTYGLNSLGEVYTINANRSEKMNLNLSSKVMEIVPFQNFQFFDAE